ncbi:hypothetical protein LAT59_04210, partial [Candidatus Gracilibacteria bacterium]|nr:hypothetical protein [Candidatus Gracilibacteria bacterium]
AYYGIQADGDTFQRGVRIIGLTSSQRTEELTSGQFTNDARILGQITKAELRRDMQRNVSQITRNIEATPQGTSGTPRVTLQTSGNGWGSLSSGGGLILSQGDILYFKNPTTGIVRISGEVSGQKTLIVENGNVYIDGNITGNGTLGIVVLREDNAGGNVYIDPSVTDIHASMFVDRSIISYDGVELDGNTSANILRHQLYIYGSVFSENTIGTSRSADVLCPFYVPTSSCNQVTAQKYDFNYLRRYFINRNGDASGSESSKRSSADISLRDYPVIIEYNSNIQTSPPPLFDIQQ